MIWWAEAMTLCPDFFRDHRQGYSGPLGFILWGLVEDISSEGWQNMKPNRQVMVILRSEIWYFSSKIQNLEQPKPITLCAIWLDIARILEISAKSPPKSWKNNFLHKIFSFPGFREALNIIYVVHKCGRLPYYRNQLLFFSLHYISLQILGAGNTYCRGNQGGGAGPLDFLKLSGPPWRLPLISGLTGPRPPPANSPNHRFSLWKCVWRFQNAKNFRLRR